MSALGAKRDLHGIQARPPLRGQLISPYTLRPANSRCMLCLIAESHDLVRRRKRPNRGADARLRAVLWCDSRPAGQADGQLGKHTRERTVADEAKDFGFAKKQSLFAELRR
jgi:hypothetical protein